MSGAGKSRAAICLEDSGYYIVDNLPAEMMVKFAEFCAAAGGRYDRLAFVYDVRAGEPFDRLTGAVEELRRQGLRCRLLFLEADTKTIINRYKETRRSHPLCGDGASIEEAVARERAMLAPVRAQADLVLDTSAFSAAKLRSTLLTLLGRESDGGLHVTVLSFGFKNGLPPEADLVLDVRFLPNPYYVPELKRLTGLDVANALLFAGLGTLLFHLITGRKVPAFLGSSFAFIGGYNAIRALGTGNETLPYACFGVACAGLVYLIMAFFFKQFGAKKVMRYFPPIVTGPIIICIGLTLSGSAVTNCSAN